MTDKLIDGDGEAVDRRKPEISQDIGSVALTITWAAPEWAFRTSLLDSCFLEAISAT